MKGASMVPLAAASLHQERRSLRGGAFRWGAVIGTGSSASYGSSGGGGLNGTQVIIIAVAFCTAMALLALLVLGCGICNWKTSQNPNWKFRDYFKRKNIPAAERSEATLHETRGHGEDTALPAAHDNPRPNLGSKSRKQAAAPREPW